MREAWPYASAHRFLILDRDSKFSGDVVSAAQDLGSKPVRTAFRSPWQNGVAERWVGSCRRDLLDHVIILNQRYLKRLMAEYIRYYHEDRTHLGLAKDTPAGRPVESRSAIGSPDSFFAPPRRAAPSLRPRGIVPVQRSALACFLPGRRVPVADPPDSGELLPLWR
jgi:hypothetical protein